jgi:hypothetical protein
MLLWGMSKIAELLRVLFIIVDTGQHYKFTYKHVTDSGQEALFE